MTRYRVTVTLEADSAAEAVSTIAVDSEGEFIQRFRSLEVQEDIKPPLTQWYVS